MKKSATVRARIEADLKKEVESLFKELGMSTTEAINIFYKQVKLRRGLPFEVCIPNELTEKTLKETEEGKNLTRYKDAEDMFNNLGI